MPYLGGRTNTTSALNLLRRVVFQTSAGDRPGAPNVAVLVANGESTLDQDRVSTEAVAGRDAGIVFVVVAADQTVNESMELQSIVSPPAERNYFTTRALSRLPNITQSVIPAMLLCPPAELQTGQIMFTLPVNFDIIHGYSGFLHFCLLIGNKITHFSL